DFENLKGHVNSIDAANDATIQLNVLVDCSSGPVFDLYFQFPRNNFNPTNQQESNFERFRPVLTQVSKGSSVTISGVLFMPDPPHLWPYPFIGNIIGPVTSMNYPPVKMNAKMNEMRVE